MAWRMPVAFAVRRNQRVFAQHTAGVLSTRDQLGHVVRVLSKLAEVGNRWAHSRSSDSPSKPAYRRGVRVSVP